MANLFRCGGSGNPYLRYDEETGEIQAMNESGNWIDVYHTEVLPLPNEFVVFENGTSQIGALTGVAETYGHIDITTSAIKCYSNNNQGCLASKCFITPVDVTNYSKIHFVLSNASEKTLWLGLNSTKFTSYAAPTKYVTGSNGDISLDISTLTGDMYVSICIRDVALKTSYVTKIWFE